MRYELTPDLLTGSALIDSEHRQLFVAINSLWRSAKKEEGVIPLSRLPDSCWITLGSILPTKKSCRFPANIRAMAPTKPSMKITRRAWLKR